MCELQLWLLYFRELETELLLVATHFIEKDKDFRLPRNLRVGSSIVIVNAKKIIADHFSVSFTDWILRFSFFLFLALVSGRSHWLGGVWPSASGQIRCSFRFVDKWSSLFGKQETGKKTMQSRPYVFLYRKIVVPFAVPLHDGPSLSSSI